MGGNATIYHACPRVDWEAARVSGTYTGNPVDRTDGFIHFSTGGQLAETLARHRTGERGLVLLTVRADALGPELRWETSRGGDDFPHLYGTLPVAAVERADTLALDATGRHVLPPHVAKG